MSMPSAMTHTDDGVDLVAWVDPKERISIAPCATLVRWPAAIWERPALWTQWIAPPGCRSSGLLDRSNGGWRRPARALNGSRSRPAGALVFALQQPPLPRERNTRPAWAGSVDAGLWIVHRAFAQAGNDAPMTLSEDEQHSSDPNLLAGCQSGLAPPR